MANKLKEKIEQMYGELISTVYYAESLEDSKKFEDMLIKMKELIDEYEGKNKQDLIEYMLEKNKKLTTIIKEKMKNLSKEINRDYVLNKNRGLYKLYE